MSARRSSRRIRRIPRIPPMPPLDQATNAIEEWARLFGINFASIKNDASGEREIRVTLPIIDVTYAASVAAALGAIVGAKAFEAFNKDKE